MKEDKSFHYTDVNFLARFCCMVALTCFDRLFEELIFAPWKMTETRFDRSNRRYQLGCLKSKDPKARVLPSCGKC